MNPAETNALEHRGIFARPDSFPYGSTPPSPYLEDGTKISVEGAASKLYEDLKSRLHWVRKSARRYRAIDDYVQETPFNFGGMKCTEYVNQYVSQRLEGVKPRSIRIPRKFKYQAEVIIEFLSFHSGPVPAEQIYWSTGYMPSEFFGKGIGDIVRPNQIVRADANPNLIHDYLSIGKDNEVYNDGNDLVCLGGCTVVIRNAHGLISHYGHWMNTEYLLPMDSKFLITDMYKANIPHCFELYKNITFIEVQMLTPHK